MTDLNSKAGLARNKTKASTWRLKLRLGDVYGNHGRLQQWVLVDLSQANGQLATAVIQVVTSMVSFGAQQRSYWNPTLAGHVVGRWLASRGAVRASRRRSAFSMPWTRLFLLHVFCEAIVTQHDTVRQLLHNMTRLNPRVASQTRTVPRQKKKTNPECTTAGSLVSRPPESTGKRIS